MSFTRVNVGGWAVGSQLTSAQQNQLDIDHANALDKSAAGDTIVGPITLGVGGSITTTSGNTVLATVAGAIQATVPYGVYSGVAGGLGLTGHGDYPKFFAQDFRSVASQLFYNSLQGTWLPGAGTGYDYLIGPATSTGQVLRIPEPHNGATLSSVSIEFSVFQSHPNVPANLPSIGVYRTPANVVNGVVSQTNLSTTPVQSFTPAPGTGAAWYNTGLTQLLTYTCNLNNVIDTSQYLYGIVLTDENGANSLNGNQYYAMTLNFTNIQDMRFP